MKVDTKELQLLVTDLQTAGTRLNRQVLPIMKRTGGNVMRGGQDRVRAGMHKRGGSAIKHYPRSITFTTTQNGARTQTDTGPEDYPAKIQGAFGEGIEHGSVNTPPIPHMIPAFEAEVPVAVRFLLDAASKLLRR